MMDTYKNIIKIPGRLMRDTMLLDTNLIVAGAANAGEAALNAGAIVGKGIKPQQ